MISNMVAAFGTKVAKATLSTNDAATLYDDVTATQVDDEVKDAIQTLIDEKLSGDASMVAKSSGKQKLSPQLLTSISAYLTKS